jgi:transposase
MTFAQAVDFYNISPTTIQKWKKRIHSKTTRQVKPHKITDERLFKDVKDYPDSYHYERARRLKCSKSGICETLKRLGISQKKTLEHPKACPIKRAAYQSKLNSFMQQGYPIVYMDERK